MIQILRGIEVHGNTTIYGNLYVKGNIIVENDVIVSATGDVICNATIPQVLNDTSNSINSIVISNNNIYINNTLEMNPAKIGLYVLQYVQNMKDMQTDNSDFNKLFEI